MAEKTKILFVGPAWGINSSFIKKDLGILQEHFKVTPLYPGIRTFLKIIPKIVKSALVSELSFIWFGGYHAAITAFFSKLFRKKTIVVAGGYDVASLPEIKYGLMQGGFRKIITISSFKAADKILAVSDFIKNEVLTHYNTNNIKTIYLGFNSQKYKPLGEKEHLVITVVGRVNRRNLQIKGLKTFVESAQFLPDVQFLLIGKHLDESIKHLKSIASSNVKFPGFISPEELPSYYQKAKVYVQVSAREGFGSALAESMLCECIPVVTKRGAMPEIVGNTGFYVPYGEPESTAAAIKKALNVNGERARERIKQFFPIEKREKELLREIKELLTNQHKEV